MLHVCHSKSHLDIPSSCPDPLADQLLKCWAYNPTDRPSFAVLLDTIEELMTELQHRQDEGGKTVAASATSAEDQCSYAMLAETVYSVLEDPSESLESTKVQGHFPNENLAESEATASS